MQEIPYIRHLAYRAIRAVNRGYIYIYIGANRALIRLRVVIITVSRRFDQSGGLRQSAVRATIDPCNYLYESYLYIVPVALWLQNTNTNDLVITLNSNNHIK